MGDQLLRHSVGSLGIRLAGQGLGLLAVAYIAKILGAAGFGVYSTAMGWVAILMIFSALGFPNLIVRSMSAGMVNNDWSRMRGLLQISGIVVLAVSLLGILMVAALSWWLFQDSEQERIRVAIWVALALVPLRSLGRLRLAALRGLNYVFLAQLPEMILRPGLFLLICLLAMAYGGPFGPFTALGLQITATASAFLFGVVCLHRLLPPAIRAARAEYNVKPWLMSAWHLLLYAGLYTLLLQTGVVMLGAMAGESEAGAYALTARAAEVVTVFLAAVNNPLMPLMSRAHAQADRPKLQSAVSRGTLYATLAAIGPALCLALAAGPLLAFFGEGYGQATIALRILALTQILNVMFGPVGTLLNVTGHERLAAYGMLAAAFTNILLNIILIPLWSVTGAAIAFMVATIVWNCCLGLLVYKKLSIVPGVIVWLSFRKKRYDQPT